MVLGARRQPSVHEEASADEPATRDHRLWPFGPLYLTESTIDTGGTRGRVGLGPVATRETEGLRDQGYLRTT